MQKDLEWVAIAVLTTSISTKLGCKDLSLVTTDSETNNSIEQELHMSMTGTVIVGVVTSQVVLHPTALAEESL